MTLRVRDPKNFTAGLLFLAIGAAAAAIASDYRMGTALHMGPGYYPFAVALLLALTGLGAMLRALAISGPPLGPIAWRPAAIITTAVLVFAASVDRAGLIPATLLAVAIACLAARPLRLAQSALLACALAILAAAIFIFGLKLPFTLLGTLFG